MKQGKKRLSLPKKLKSLEIKEQKILKRFIKQNSGRLKNSTTILFF